MKNKVIYHTANLKMHQCYYMILLFIFYKKQIDF